MEHYLAIREMIAVESLCRKVETSAAKGQGKIYKIANSHTHIDRKFLLVALLDCCMRAFCCEVFWLFIVFSLLNEVLSV
jgi:hypothetical protein